MRYVVTGAAGFIGSHICIELLQDGHDVVGVDSFTDYYDVSLKRRNAALLVDHERFVGVDDDLVAIDLNALFQDTDVVIHLAGQPGVRLSWAEHFHLYVDRNITASQRLLEAARQTAVPRVVLASSSSVYGNAPSYPTTEDSPTRPFSPYGVTKLAMEQLAWSYAENWGLPVVALRYFTVYGPRQRPDMGMHRFIAKAASGEPIVVYGDGGQVRDFTFVSDVAAATIAASKADLPTPAVFNVAGGSSGTVNEVLRLVSEHVGRPVRVRHDARQPGDVRVTGGAIDLARRFLNWEPAIPLDEGIKRQVAHQLGPDNGWHDQATACPPVCIDSLAPAGAERSLTALAPHLLSEGIDLQVGYFVERDGLRNEIERAGARVTSLDVGDSRRARLLRTIAMLEEVRPDVLHTTLSKPTSPVAEQPPECTFHVCPVWSTPRTAVESDANGIGFLKVRAAHLADAATARHVTRFHAVTQHVATVMGRRLRIRSADRGDSAWA